LVCSCRPWSAVYNKDAKRAWQLHKLSNYKNNDFLMGENDRF